MSYKYKGKNYPKRTAVIDMLLRIGTPIQKIADSVDVTYPAVYLYLKAQEKKGRTFPRVPNQRDKAQKNRKKMKELAEKGFTRTQISKKMHVSYPLVVSRLAEAGIEVEDMRGKHTRKKKVQKA